MFICKRFHVQMVVGTGHSMEVSKYRSTILWASFEYHLSICWVSYEYHLSIRFHAWLSFEYHLSICWVSFEYLVSIFWVSDFMLDYHLTIIPRGNPCEYTKTTYRGAADALRKNHVLPYLHLFRETAFVEPILSHLHALLVWKQWSPWSIGTWQNITNNESSPMDVPTSLDLSRPHFKTITTIYSIRTK